MHCVKCQPIDVSARDADRPRIKLLTKCISWQVLQCYRSCLLFHSFTVYLFWWTYMKSPFPFGPTKSCSLIPHLLHVEGQTGEESWTHSLFASSKGQKYQEYRDLGWIFWKSCDTSSATLSPGLCTYTHMFIDMSDAQRFQLLTCKLVAAGHYLLIPRAFQNVLIHEQTPPSLHHLLSL